MDFKRQFKRACLLAVIVVGLQSLVLHAQETTAPAPRGLNFDRFGFVSSLNDRFFALYNSLFDAIQKDEVGGAKLVHQQFEKDLAEINHIYFLRAWKLQPHADLAWYEAMRSLHRALGQKVRGQELPLVRVNKVDLDPALWSVCPGALTANPS